MKKLETIETLMCKDKREHEVSRIVKKQCANSSKSKKKVNKQTENPVMAMCGD